MTRAILRIAIGFDVAHGLLDSQRARYLTQVAGH